MQFYGRKVKVSIWENDSFAGNLAPPAVCSAIPTVFQTFSLGFRLQPHIWLTTIWDSVQVSSEKAEASLWPVRQFGYITHIMGCTTSSPYRDYYLELERRKKVKCNCQCHKNGLGMPLEHLGPYLPAARDSLSLKADPRIPLTGRQIFLIKRSWKGISRNMCETGINMFLR